MNEIDERTERLIARRLDGALTPSEQDELNQVLLRSGDARRILGDYQENDRLATDVIGAVAERRWPGEAEPIRAGRFHRVAVWGPVVAGMAAAAVIAIMLLSPWQTRSVQPPTTFGPTPPIARSDRPEVTDDNLVYTRTELPYRGERRIDREYIGVFDESRNALLLFQVDRTRIVRIPVAGDL